MLDKCKKCYEDNKTPDKSDCEKCKMTEEIIIDGVDVNNCDLYCSRGYCMDDNISPIDCKDRHDCEYKQLKRLEQERDELKKTVENQKLEYEELQCDLSEVENACGCYQSENAELKQENKTLKDNNNQLQAIIDDGRAENKRFREENKILKSNTNVLNDYITKNEQLKTNIDNLVKKNEKLKSALKEIREIAEKYKDMEGCRIPLGAIKMTVDKVLNLS